MNTKTVTILIAMVAMIGMTGIGSAMNTNVVYNGDGQYNCNYNAVGTGYIGIHTYTNDGSDHLMSGWTNSKASGWQKMETDTSIVWNSNYNRTTIERSATIGGVAIGEDEAGYIWTLTTDNNNNSVMSYANYHDDEGYGSHITTDQTVIVGSYTNNYYNTTSVTANTEIDGFAYGNNTTVSGLIRTESDDEYTYAYLQMDNGEMNLHTFNSASSIDSTWTPYNGTCGQFVITDANGVGIFAVGAGTDKHIVMFRMKDNLGTTNYRSSGINVTMDMETTFNGNFTGHGFIYAIDLN